MAVVFTGGELSRWLDAGTLEKGRQRVSAVRALGYRAPLLTAQVEAWQVAIDLEASARAPHSPLQSRCTCPAGGHCEHVAAVLLAALDTSLEGDAGVLRPAAHPTLPTLQIQAMTPILHLHSMEYRPAWLTERDPSQWLDVATVAFEYDEHVRFLDDPSLFVHDAEGELYLLPRDLHEEARREAELLSVHLHRERQPRIVLDGGGPLFELRSFDWTRSVWTCSRRPPTAARSTWP